MSIGSRIKEFAKKEYGGVGKLAVKLEISQPQLSQYISGINKPGADFLTKLAKLGADINWILTGEAYVNKELVVTILTRLEEMEAEITKLKANMYDLQRDNKQLAAEKERLIKTVETLEQENEELKELNKTLGAQYSRVAEVNHEYNKRKMKKKK